MDSKELKKNTPTKEKEQTTLRLPADEMKYLNDEAYKLGYSLNTYLTMLIRLGRQHPLQ